MASGSTPTEVISLSGLFKYFKDYTSLIDKGEIKYKNGYVLQVKLLDMEIEAVVRASMGDKSYTVRITVDGSGDILKSSCACYRGQWLCSHVAGATIYINKTGVSKTDLPNSWLARPKKASKTVSSVKISEHFPKTEERKKFRVSSRKVLESDLEFLHNKLKVCSLKWMLSPEPAATSKSELEPKCIDEILHVFVTDKSSFIEMCRVSHEQISWVAKNTADQRNSILWGRLRRLRLTGSNFGKVIVAYNRNAQKNTPYPESLFKSLKGEYRMEGKDSIMWGQMHEDVAINAYIAKTKNQVEKIGLCLFECGYLGSSPDGRVIAPDGVGVP